MPTECVVGIDVGTTSTRVTVYNAAGTLLAEGRSPHDITHPHPGWAEQDAETWWIGVCAAARQAFDQLTLPRDAIKGIAVTSMRQTFVCLGRDLQAVRPAIVWYDTRHAEQVDWVQTEIGSRKVYEMTGSPPGRRTIYKVMWLKAHEPEAYEATAHILFIPDYITLRLTGELITTPGVAFTSGCLNVSNPTEWATPFITACGVDPDKWIKTVNPPGQIAGRVTAQAAAETGFPVGAPVVLASGDQACGNLGAGVCQPGMLGVNGGTSCALQTPSEKLPVDEAMSFFIDFSPAGYYVAENGVTSGTAALSEWFRDNLGYPEVAKASSQDELWDLLYNLTRRTPKGNQGLMLVPYLRGANGPLWDPRARGVLIGLTADHNRAHLLRALLEGLAYESRRILESMEKSTGVAIHSVRAYGGASQSDVWNQLFADVLNRPVTVTTEKAPVSLGAAITAGYGAGLYENPLAAAGRMVAVRKVYEPDRAHTALYEDLYHEVYVHLYSHLEDLTATASRITAPGERQGQP